MQRSNLGSSDNTPAHRNFSACVTKLSLVCTRAAAALSDVAVIYSVMLLP